MKKYIDKFKRWFFINFLISKRFTYFTRDIPRIYRQNKIRKNKEIYDLSEMD